MHLPRLLRTLLLGILLFSPLSALAQEDDDFPFDPSFKGTEGWKRDEDGVFTHEIFSIEAEIRGNIARQTAFERARELKLEFFGNANDITVSANEQYATFTDELAADGDDPAMVAYGIVYNSGAPEEQVVLSAVWPKGRALRQQSLVGQLMDAAMEHLRRNQNDRRPRVTAGPMQVRVSVQDMPAGRLLYLPQGVDMTVGMDPLVPWHGTLIGYAQRRRAEFLANDGVSCGPLVVTADGTAVSFAVTGIAGVTQWAAKLPSAKDYPRQRPGFVLDLIGFWFQTTDMGPPIAFWTFLTTADASLVAPR